MFAKLCITSSYDRRRLSAEFLQSNPVTEDSSRKQSKLGLETLYNRDTPLPTPAEISGTGLLDILGSLDEADWVRLALLCDKCDVSTSNNDLLFAVAQKRLSDTTSSAITRTNAYYFLKSQNQEIDPNSLTEKLVPAIHTLETAEAQTEAWAILLADPSCPNQVLQTFNTEQALELLSAVIPWTAKNNKNRLTNVMPHFIALQNPELTLALIHFGFDGTIKLEVLKETLQRSTAFEGAPEFNIVFFEKNLAAHGENGQTLIETIFNQLKEITDQTLGEKPVEQKEALFKSFIAPALKTHTQHLLYSAKTILNSHDYLLGEFSKLASAMEVTSETVAWLSQAIIRLSQNWRLEEELPKLAAKENLKGDIKDLSQYVREDLTKYAVRDIISKIIFILTVPGVWDQIVENSGDSFSESLEKILNMDSKDFFRSITRLPWQQNESGQRICSNTTIDWLFNLTCMKNLDFIQPNDDNFRSNGEIYLGYLFKFNDSYVIKKLFEANTKLNSQPLFCGLIKDIDNYTTALEPAILPLLTHPDFHIEHYYEHASEAFKQLPQVKAAMQLQYFFHTKSVEHLVCDDAEIINIKLPHHPETFFQALKYRHLNDLHEMTIALSTAELSNDQALYEKAISLHKQIKKLPAEARRDLNQDIRFAAFSLAHRICKDKSANETESDTKQAGRSVKKFFTQVTKGHLVTGKDAKIPFLQCILNHLIKFSECQSNNTDYANAPFIWSVYVESYLTVKREAQNKLLTSEDTTYSLDKMTKINTWLNDQILDGKNTKKTLALLPGNLLNAIFAGTNVNIVEFTEIGERLLNESQSDDGDDDSESKKESVAETVSAIPRRKSIFESPTIRAILDSRRDSVSTPPSEMCFPMEDFWAEVREPRRVHSSVTAYSGSTYATFTGLSSDLCQISNLKKSC